MNKNKLLVIIGLVLCVTMSVLPAQAGTKRYVPSVTDWVAAYASATQGIFLDGLEVRVLPFGPSVLVQAVYDSTMFTQSGAESIAEIVANGTRDYITSRKIKNLSVEIDVSPQPLR